MTAKNIRKNNKQNMWEYRNGIIDKNKGIIIILSRASSDAQVI